MEKLQISSANWIDGTGRPWRLGGSQFDLKAKMRSAMKRLNRRGGREGPPGVGPHLWRKVVPTWPLPLYRMRFGYTYVQLACRSMGQDHT